MMMWLVDFVGLGYVCFYGVGVIWLMIVDGMLCLMLVCVVDMFSVVGLNC